MTATTKVSVDIEDFKRSHRALIHLLQTLDKANGKLSTRQLLQAMNNWGAHGQSVIRKAEREGYIKRTRSRSEHGHFPRVYNILLVKGKRLLSNL